MCTIQLLRVSVHERISAAAEDVLHQLEKREEAADLLVLRALITKRLVVAAEEIVALLEKAVLEYEDRVQRSKQEVYHQNRLLEHVLKPQVSLQKTVFSAEIQTKNSSSLDQEDLQGPQPPHIKVEQEEIWTGEDREQLQRFQDNDIAKLILSPVRVKNDDDEDKPQSSERHHSHTKRSRNSLGGLEPIRTSDPQSFLQPVSEKSSPDSAESDESDWIQNKEVLSGGEEIQNSEVPDSDAGSTVKEQPFSCSYCGRRFSLKGNLNRHIRDHTGERPFPCTDCDKSFKDSGSLTAHMRCHTGEQPYSCLFCGKNFSGRGNMTRHMRIHTGEKPFTCSVCNKGFHVKEHLSRHMKYHTGEKPFTCSICGKGCAQKTDLKKHMRVHTGEKPFSCSFCGKCCAEKGDLTKHMRVHTGEKPFSCNICGKSCAQKGSLKIHMRVHTGEKPFSCSVCGKCFTVTGHLKRHMKLHSTEESSDVHLTKAQSRVNTNESGKAL